MTQDLASRGAVEQFAAMDRSILIVRPGALGDTILTFPLLASVRAKHPRSRITLLGSRRFKEILPPGVQFQAIDDPEWLWLFSGKRKGVDPGRPVFDCAYVILNRPRDVVENLKANGTSRVVCSTSTPPEGVHLVEHLHRGTGLPVPHRSPALLHLAAGGKKDLLWVHPGSGGPGKCVPLELTINFVRQVRVQTGLPVAITASEEDAFLQEQGRWETLINSPQTVLLQNRPLTEICRELGGARLFVGNDSGMAHMAAGLGIPSTIFYVATDPIQWSPWVPENQLRIIDLRGNAKPERLALISDQRGGPKGATKPAAEG